MGNDNNSKVDDDGDVDNNADSGVIVTVVELPPGSGAAFDVIFHRDLVDMGMLMDLGEYFTGLVRNQVIRTREPVLEQTVEPEDGSKI